MCAPFSFAVNPKTLKMYYIDAALRETFVGNPDSHANIAIHFFKHPIYEDTMWSFEYNIFTGALSHHTPRYLPNSASPILFKKSLYAMNNHPSGRDIIDLEQQLGMIDFTEIYPGADVKPIHNPIHEPEELTEELIMAIKYVAEQLRKLRGMQERIVNELYNIAYHTASMYYSDIEEALQNYILSDASKSYELYLKNYAMSKVGMQANVWAALKVWEAGYIVLEDVRHNVQVFTKNGLLYNGPFSKLERILKMEVLYG